MRKQLLKLFYIHFMASGQKVCKGPRYTHLLSSLLVPRHVIKKCESDGQAFLTVTFCLPGSTSCSSLLQFVKNDLHLPGHWTS